MSDTIIRLAMERKITIATLEDLVKDIIHSFVQGKEKIGIAKNQNSVIYNFLENSHLYVLVKIDIKSYVITVKYCTTKDYVGLPNKNNNNQLFNYLDIAYAISSIILAENAGHLKENYLSSENEDFDNVLSSLKNNFRKELPYSILGNGEIQESWSTSCSVETCEVGEKVFKSCFGDNFKITNTQEQKEDGKYNSNTGNQMNFSIIPSKNDCMDSSYSMEEKVLIPSVESWYVMPKFITTIFKLIKSTEKTLVPMRNFLFRGNAGTGKTEGAKALAAILKRPYVTYTCSSDTEIFDFLGQAIPNKEGKIVFSETSFITALKNGYVIEIQEPSVILKEGVLVGLNGLLDQTNTFTLPTGEVIKRHPQCVVVFTTNSSYVGCNDINQSVISRCDAIYDFAEPSDKEVLKRIVNLTGQTTLTTTIETMITVTKKIRRFLEEQDICDGVCGMREIIGWVLCFVVTGDIIESARHTIVSKATGLKEYHSAILGLVKAVFSV